MQILASTPKSIKILIWITAAVALLSPPLSYFLLHTFHFSGPNLLLPLSLYGLFELWLWQPFTYLFVQTTELSISLALLVSLFFQMLLLWFSGTEITNRYGHWRFLALYFGGGWLAGLIAAGLLYLSQSQEILLGASPALFASLMVWALLFSQVRLGFFLLPISGKKIVYILFIISLVIHLARFEWINMAAEIIGILYGAFFAHFVLKGGAKISLRPSKKKQKVKIETLHSDTDEAFLDRMLDKVARFGKESLSENEKERLHRIVKRRH